MNVMEFGMTNFLKFPYFCKQITENYYFVSFPYILYNYDKCARITMNRILNINSYGNPELKNTHAY